MKFKKITVCFDMAGCPNRCKHCWLGAEPNRHRPADDLLYIANAFRPFTQSLEIASWYREPDFRDDYKELWNMECSLSDEKLPHFELASFWRLTRDADYAGWLSSLGVRACQFTLFGSETVTDYYVGRKGAFEEILESVDILLNHNIAPRIQVFVNRNNLNVLHYIESLIDRLDFDKHCQAIGQDFNLFIHQGSCEGENEKLYDIRVTGRELDQIPKSLTDRTLKYFNCSSLYDIFGKPEDVLYTELLLDNTVKSIQSDTPVFYINGDYKVFPNASQPAAWWCLGNLKSGSAEQIIKNYQYDYSTAQKNISTIPLSQMVRRCGNPNSQRLFTKGDYITYIQNQFCKLQL